MGNITCRLCNTLFSKINWFTHHLRSTHKIDKTEYINKYFEDFVPFGWNKCIECSEIFRSFTTVKCGKCYTRNHKINTDQFIRCTYCNDMVHSKVFSQHLKVHHNIKFKDYVEDNIEDFKRFGWCNCIICNNITKKQGKRHDTTCSKECLVKYRKTLVGKKSPRFGKIVSDESRKKMSIANLGRKNPSMQGNLNPACRHEVRKKISKTRIDRKVAVGENNPMYGKTHTPEAIQKIFSHRTMNKLEELVAKQLDDSSIEYYFQYFINENGICKSYDFKIKNKPLIIEIDGDYWHGNPNIKNHYKGVDVVRKNDKLKNEIATKKGLQIIRIWESDIKKDPSIVLKYIS